MLNHIVQLVYDWTLISTKQKANKLNLEHRILRLNVTILLFIADLRIDHNHIINKSIARQTKTFQRFLAILKKKKFFKFFASRNRIRKGFRYYYIPSVMLISIHSSVCFILVT